MLDHITSDNSKPEEEKLFKSQSSVALFCRAIVYLMHLLSKTAALLAVLFIASFSISVIPVSSHASASSTDYHGYSLVNLENFTDYGQFIVNDTLVVQSNASQSLSSVTLGFPSLYNGHIFQLATNEMVGGASSSTASFSTSVVNQTLEVTISLPKAIGAGTAGNVSLQFYVVGTYISQNSTSSSCSTCDYLVPLLFYPSTNVPLDSLKSTITFPNTATTSPQGNTTTVVGDHGFALTSTGSIETYQFSTSNVTSSSKLDWANVSVGTLASSGGIVEFQNIERTIGVNSAGTPIVTDSFTVKNLGPNTLSSLTMQLLSNPNQNLTVTIEPTGNPPLSNTITTSVTDATINILTSSGTTVEPNATDTVIVQYPLGSRYWNYSGETYSASIPLSAPIKAIVNNFVIKFNVPSGFVRVQVPSTISLTNSLGSSGIASFSYKIGVGSSYGFVLPIAGVAFIGVFFAALIFRPKGQKKEEEVESTLISLVKAVEDKVSGTNEILTELKSKGSSVTRVDLSTARIRIEDLRSKSSLRLSSIRSELGPVGSSVQEGLSEVAGDDREFDRAVKDLLNSYDQFISRRMKQDSFTRSQQNNERRIQGITNTLLDTLQDVRREFEQEQ